MSYFKSAEIIEICTFKSYNQFRSAKMKESLKRKYYQLSKDEFNELLDSIRNNPDTIVLFKELDKQYYFLLNNNISTLLIELHKKQWEFDGLMNSFSEFGRKQIIQSFLLDEIQSSNSIENIYSTRHDIFYLINGGLNIKDKKTECITKAYSILLKKEIKNIETLSDIRNVYDLLMYDIIEKENIPDGKYFRKDRVYISDGIKNIHAGYYPEDKIISAMKDFLKIYNDKDLDLYVSLPLTHFVFETVHPFYDGNGRLGRLLLSMKMFNDTSSYMSFILSKAIKNNKTKYYRALEKARDDREYGLLNQFVYDFDMMILNSVNQVINEINEKKNNISTYLDENKYSKSETKILSILNEATVLSDYGVSMNEIIENTHLSKRIIAYTIKKLKTNNKLSIKRIGKNNYYSLIQ